MIRVAHCTYPIYTVVVYAEQLVSFWESGILVQLGTCMTSLQ